MSVQIFGKGKKVALQRRHARLRKRISGTPELPRLVVTRSNRHMVAQIIDDTKGVTLVSESTLTSDFAGFEGTKTEAAKKVGELIAKKAQDAGITDVLTKSMGSATAVNVVRATVDALKKLEEPEEIAARRGMSLEEVAPDALLRARAEGIAEARKAREEAQAKAAQKDGE